MTSVNDIADYSVIASDVYNENQDNDTGKNQAYDKIKSKEYKTDTLTLERKIYQKFDNDIDVSVYFRESKSQSGEVLPEIVVSFGGTNGAMDFLSDLRRGFNPYNPEMEKIRSSVRNEISEIEKKHKIKDIKVTSVGHSLGGCYAELFAASFYGDEENDSGKRVNVMTFNGFGAALGLRDYNNFAKKDKGFNGEQYKPERIGLSEHYSNEKDGVSMITGHLGNSSSYIIPTDVSGIHGLDNHSIENLIKDLIKVTNGSKEIILSEKNNIAPGDYSSFFSDKEGVIEQFERYKHHIIGTREDNTFIGGEIDDFIDGYIGNDTIVGNGGNDFLFGGIGRDILADSAIKEDVYIYENGIKKKVEKYTPLVSSRVDSGNVYVGGKDDDSIYDTAGNDTIFYNKGDGHDLIALSETLRDSDKVIFGEDIKPGDLSFTVSGDKMVMHIAKGKDKEGSLTFDNWFTSKETSAQKVELFVFKDGTELTWQQISEMATMAFRFGTENNKTTEEIYGKDRVKNVIFGLSGNDILSGMGESDIFYGGDGIDTLGDYYEYSSSKNGNTYIGGKGRDTLKDSYGNDTYIYNKGDGEDVFKMTGFSDNDKIIFGEGLSLSDFSYSFSGASLYITINKGTSSEGSLWFDEWYRHQLTRWTGSDDNSGYKIESFEFSDGTKKTWREMESIAESSLLVTNNNNNTVNGFNWRENKIDGLGGNDVLKGGDLNDVINGGEGNDIINGGYRNDELTGGKGDDIIEDSNGKDRIFYSLGDGNDTVIVNHTGVHDPREVSDDRIVFSGGISKEDISFKAMYRDLLISVSKNGRNDGSVTIKDWFMIDDNDLPLFKIDGVEFSNKEFISRIEINNIVRSTNNKGDEKNNEIIGFHWKNNIIQGGDGNDSLTGGNFYDEFYGDDGDDLINIGGTDLVSGGKGNDVIYNRAYNPTIIYNKGDGDDIIHSSSERGGTISFGQGISESDISFNYKNGNTIVAIKNSGTITQIKYDSISYYKFYGDSKAIWSYDLQEKIKNRSSKPADVSSRTSRQYDLLSQEMAASDADAEPSVDYNKQSQDLYAYIEH